MGDGDNDNMGGIAFDQLVPSPRGPRFVGDLTTGTKVYGFNGGAVQTSSALAVLRRAVEPLWTVALGTRAIDVTATTKLLVLDGGLTTWRPVEQLAIRDIVLCAEGYYPTTVAWRARKARLVGAFLGDGWLRQDPVRSGYSLGLAIGRGDELHTTKYLKLAEEVLPNRGWGRGWRADAPGHFGLSCSSRSSWVAARDLGLGSKARDKQVPADAFGLNRDDKLALLAGYFDADGSVAGPGSSNHGRGCVAGTSEQLVVGLRELAIACALHVTAVITSRRSTNYGTASVWRFTIAADSTAELPLWHRAKAANQRVTSRRSKAVAARHLSGARLGMGIHARRVRDVVPAAPRQVVSVAADAIGLVAAGVVVAGR